MFQRLSTGILIVLGVMLLRPLQAQITLNMEQPDLAFQRALNVYEKGLYNKAIRGFNKYIDKTDNSEYRHEARYYIASSKLKLNQSGAIMYAEWFLKEHPFSPRRDFVYKDMADYYFHRKRYRSAAKYYAKVDLSILSRDETDAFLFNKGYSLFEAEKYEEAKEALYPLTLRPHAHYNKAVYYYGYVCYMNQDYAEALEAFLSIEEKGPQTMKLYICQIYYLMAQYEQAISYAEKINLGKWDNKKHEIMGKSYFRLRNFEQASAYFSKAFLNYDKLTEDELYEIGYSYYKTEDCNKAFVAFSKIANNGTAIAQVASYHLGSCFVRKNKKQNAYNAFFEAQRTDFDKEIKENAMFNLGKISFELEDYNTAIATFNRFIETFPESQYRTEAQKNLAKLFLVTTDYRSAIPILESLPASDRESAEILHQILVLYGEELMLKKQIAEARAIFTKASEKRTQLKYYALAHFWLGEIEFMSQNKATAAKHYQIFLGTQQARQTPYFNYAHYAMGYCYFDKKKYAEAIQYFSQFRQLNAQNPGEIHWLNDANLRIADCNYSLGNYQLALDNYAYISAKRAASSDYALFQQGMIFGILNQSNQKINTMKRIATEYPMSVFVEHSIFEIASEWVQLDNYMEAERNFRYLLDDFPNSMYHRQALMALGVMYYSQEKDDEALVEFKLIVSQFTGSAEAKSAMGYIERIYVSRGESAAYLSWLETVPNADISVSFRDSVSYQAAFNLYVNNQCNAAIDGFRKYLQEYPQGFFNVSATFYMANCIQQRSGFEQAIPHYRKVVQAPANEFRQESTKRLAEFYFGQERFDSSLYFFEKLENFSSDRQNLMNAYMGQIRSAFELSNLDIVSLKSQRLLRMDNVPLSIQGEVNNKLGVLHYELQDLNKALTYFTLTVDKNRDENAAEAYYFLAQIAFDKLDTDRAKTMVYDYNKQFAAFEYWQARCFLLLSQIFQKEGDAFQAKATLNFVLENYSDPDIRSRAIELSSQIN